MSSYFVNSLFSKYKSSDTLRPNYYECASFAQDLGSRPTVVYGPSTGGTFQHPSQIQEFYHHGASTLSSTPYQQNPCAVTCHGEPGNFYGYDALQRQTLFGTQETDLVQYGDCKLTSNSIGEEAENTELSPSPTQLFPWMRPQGETIQNTNYCLLGKSRVSRHISCVNAKKRPFTVLWGLTCELLYCLITLWEPGISEILSPLLSFIARFMTYCYLGVISWCKLNVT